MTDFSMLGGAKVLWDNWRFEPWRDGTAAGLYRRAAFIKAGLMGEVGRYYVDDYIIWRHDGDDATRLFRAVRHEAEVMNRRFLVVLDGGAEPFEMRRALLWGLCGYAECYGYPLRQGQCDRRIKDLAYLVDEAHQLVNGEIEVTDELKARIAADLSSMRTANDDPVGLD